MAKSFDDLLTGEFKVAEERTPASLMQDLAATLRRKVGNKIRFEVNTSSGNDQVMHSLLALLRHLHYQLEMLAVSHDVLKLYPVRVSGLLVDSPIEVADEDHLLEILAGALNGAKAQEVIGTLLAQA